MRVELHSATAQKLLSDSTRQHTARLWLVQMLRSIVGAWQLRACTRAFHTIWRQARLHREEVEYRALEQNLVSAKDAVGQMQRKCDEQVGQMQRECDELHQEGGRLRDQVDELEGMLLELEDSSNGTDDE